MRYWVLVVSTIFVISISLSHPTPKQDATTSWWWDKQWWDQGVIQAPRNYKTTIKWINYTSRGNSIPALLVTPVGKGPFYPVLFVHGRRGLDPLIQKHAIRLAARGFIVLAPDVYKGNFIGTHPIKHDYKLEQDVNKGLSVLLKQKGLKSKKACLYSHTRGGYYTLKVAVTFKRQAKDLACYISYYPHWQDPNAPEPMQVYGYAKEINELTLPTLIFIGSQEQYQRRRVIETSIKVLQDNKRDARLIIYPGVGRGFDFRPTNVRTFADDLASKDAIQRAAKFIRKHLGKK